VAKFTSTSTRLHCFPRMSSYHPHYIFDLMLLPGLIYPTWCTAARYVHQHGQLHAPEFISIDTYT